MWYKKENINGQVIESSTASESSAKKHGFTDLKFIGWDGSDLRKYRKNEDVSNAYVVASVYGQMAVRNGNFGIIIPEGKGFAELALRFPTRKSATAAASLLADVFGKAHVIHFDPKLARPDEATGEDEDQEMLDRDREYTGEY